MLKYAFIAAGVLVISAPAVAQIVIQDNPPVAAKKGAGAKSDLDQVVCRTQDTIGSRLQSHQVCMTKEQWALFEQDTKRRVEELQDLAGVRPSH